MNDIYSTKPFIQTKEYKRFVEFAQSCMEYKYIGICYGNPVVKLFLPMNLDTPKY
jgi:DNA transposition AAA+ family ATPase